MCLHLVELNLIASKNPLTHKCQKTSFDTHASIQTALLPTELTKLELRDHPALKILHYASRKTAASNAKIKEHVKLSCHC